VFGSTVIVKLSLLVSSELDQTTHWRRRSGSTESMIDDRPRWVHEIVFDDALSLIPQLAPRPFPWKFEAADAITQIRRPDVND
jgi:hypothetical protein